MRSTPTSAQWGPAVIAGNLPYYAATPIIEKTLAGPFRRAVFLVQKEVAARLTAAPGSRDYGYLSIRTQLFADVEALFDVASICFPPAAQGGFHCCSPAARISRRRTRHC